MSNLWAARGDKLELIKADKIRSFTRNNVTYRRLVGDVKLKRGDAILSCDMAEFQVQKDEATLTGKVTIVTSDSKLSGETARYYGEREYVELLGGVRFEDEPFLLTAEKMGYYIDLKKVLATQSPLLIDSSSTLSADTIFYFEESELGDARGQALMVNNADSLSVRGDHLLYFSGKDSLLSYGAAEFRKWTASDTTFRIESDSLSLEEGYFFAWPEVKIFNGGTQGSCGQAVYIQDEDIAIMRQNPVLQEDDFVLKGDIFNLHMNDGDLSSVYVPENPHFTQVKHLSDTSYTDWLDGKVMAVEFEEGQPQTVTLVEMATSFFNVIEEDEFKGTNKVSGDTLFILLSDSSISDISVIGGAEGTFSPARLGGEIDYPIDYKADNIAYSMQAETSTLRSNAVIEYGNMSMEAGQVGVYWRQNLLRAKSLTDTIGASDFPVLKQTGQEDFQGRTMIYDLKTQRGKVVAGRTKMEEGNYFGEEVTRINSDVYLMEDGYYTTCSIEEHPHFYFYSKKMKMYADKIIIAKPVVLYIAEIPVLALPFAVFPQKKGRSSGFIMPSYDYRPSAGGRGIKGFGYYWAMSEYSDFKMTGDFWDQYEEFKLRSVLRYKKRYRINGSIDASMASDRSELGRPASWKWKLRFTHNQTIDPSFAIRAEGNLSGSADFDRTYSHSQADRLDTKLHSGITVTKKFESIKSNVILGGTYDENLQVTRRINETPEEAGIALSGPSLSLPSFSFSRSSAPIIAAKGSESSWYNNFRWSYNNSFTNKRKWNYQSFIKPDSLTGDSLLWNEEITDTRSWNHGMSITGNTQVMGVLKLNGSINYTDAWGFRYLDPLLDNNGFVSIDTSNGSIITNEVEGFIRRGTFSTSVRLSTKLYGLFPLRVGALQAIRHTLTPGITLSYAPDFSKESWGYVESLIDTAGVAHDFDRFAGTDLGATSKSENLRLSYSLNNVFDYKLFRHDEETKGQFFTWGLGGSYNFRADSLKASDISNTFKINFGPNFKLSPSATFEIYKRDSTGTRKIDQFRSPRLTNAKFNFGFRLQGDAPGGLRSDRRLLMTEDSTEAIAGDGSILEESFTGRSSRGGKPAWTASFNFSYSYSHRNPLDEPIKTFNLNTGLKFNLSENWGLTYNPSFNLVDRKYVGGSVGVTRDLHCWRLTLSWRPTGAWRGINLVIRPKAQQLQDLKVEHTSNRRY